MTRVKSGEIFVLFVTVVRKVPSEWCNGFIARCFTCGWVSEKYLHISPRGANLFDLNGKLLDGDRPSGSRRMSRNPGYSFAQI